MKVFFLLNFQLAMGVGPCLRLKNSFGVTSIIIIEQPSDMLWGLKSGKQWRAYRIYRNSAR